MSQPFLSKCRHWIGQPTTLTGLSLLVGGVSGALTGALSHDMSVTLFLAALPPLLPDNSTAQRIGQAIAPVVVTELERQHTKNPSPPKT